MATDLHGRRVLAIVTNYGVEQDELVVPVEHLRAAGAHVDIAAVTSDDIQTLVGDKDPGTTVSPTTTLDEVDTSGYGLLLIPGGTLNADTLRITDRAVEIAKAFIEKKTTVAAICHGPWTLVETGALSGKTLTSYASLATDVKNAGATWVDQSVVTDDAASWTLITSRTPDDLDDFVRAIDRALVSYETPEIPGL